MKKIVIKADKSLAFLRTEALSKAIYYEEVLMNDGKKEGFNNFTLFEKKGSINTYLFVVYHTKSSIIVDIKVQVK